MANCNFNYGKCDRIATTTLTKNSGEVVQLCEHHYDHLVKLFKRIVDGELKSEHEAGANHWFVLNKIPV